MHEHVSTPAGAPTEPQPEAVLQRLPRGYDTTCDILRMMICGKGFYSIKSRFVEPEGSDFELVDSNERVAGRGFVVGQPWSKSETAKSPTPHLYRHVQDRHPSNRMYNLQCRASKTA